MINIIEHLWQFQVNNCRIVPSVVKIEKEGPKAYFYSSKQRKVLRKKEYNVDNVASVLKFGEIPQQYFLTFCVNKNREIKPQLILENQVAEMVDKIDENCVVFGLQAVDIKHIYQAKLNFQYNSFEVSPLMSCKQGSLVWKMTEECEVEMKTKQKIRGELLRILESLLQKLKVKQKCQLFQLILGANNSHTRFHCLWSNQLQWQKQHFYSIHFSFQKHEIKQTQIVEDRETIFNDFLSVKFVSEDFKPPHNEKEWELEKQEKQEQKEGKECRGCGKYRPQTDMIEVPNEDVIKLRRKHKLSILGINRQFEQICEKCSQKLEQF